MPRQKNTRPTNIYWLYDTRPETVAVFGPEGQPFYCGKTVYRVQKRFKEHRAQAKIYPHRAVSARLLACGKHVRFEIVEVVPTENDWCARETHWISLLRKVNSNCANVTNGGTGAPGIIPSAKHRAAVAKSNREREITAEMRLNMSNAQREVMRAHTPDQRAKWIECARKSGIGTPKTRRKRRKGQLRSWKERNPVPSFLEEPDGW